VTGGAAPTAGSGSPGGAGALRPQPAATEQVGNEESRIRFQTETH